MAIHTHLCKYLGHREFSSEILNDEPWRSTEFRHLSMLSFREENCLRCGEELQPVADLSLA